MSRPRLGSRPRSATIANTSSFTSKVGRRESHADGMKRPIGPPEIMGPALTSRNGRSVAYGPDVACAERIRCLLIQGGRDDRDGDRPPQPGRPTRDGLDARSNTPPSSHAGWEPGSRPSGSGRVIGGAERDPGAGSGAGAARPDGGVAVHLLPGRGQDHGRRPGRHTDGGVGRAAVRGRAPVELRRVRLPGTPIVVRPERLRRDTARAVRVRREAHGRQFHHRRRGTTGSPSRRARR